MVRRNTRKNKKISKTIPEIRKSLDRIDREVDESLVSVVSLDDKVKMFMKLWKSRIGKVIPYKMAKEYVELRLRAKKFNSRGRTLRKLKQKGGVAPLDYATRPGVYGAGAHGNFLPYVAAGDIRGFWGSGISEDCGRVDNTPRMIAGMGSNRVSGGSLTTLIGAPLQAGFRLPIGTPGSALNDLAAGINGQQLPGTTPDPSRQFTPYPQTYPQPVVPRVLTTL